MQWGCAATQLLEGLADEAQLAAAGAAVLELSGYITDQFARAVADPRDNLLGEMARACAAGEVDTVTAHVMMITLFAAGGESTASLLGSAAWILANRPDIAHQVRDNPALLGPFIEETLRFEPPFRGHYRHVLRDTTLGGVDLAAGSRLVAAVGGGQPGSEHFEAPGEFRLDRAENRSHRVSVGECTFASAPHWPDWKLRSCCGSCWIVARSSGRPRSDHGCPAFWCAV